MSMLSKIAKAIYESRNGPGCKPWSQITSAHQAPYLMDAEAVHKVVRDEVGAMHRSMVEERPDFVAFWDRFRAAHKGHE